MGSPLRQLYNFAFPHLYDWVSNPESISSEANPNPEELLGVRQWVNGFRSGDYIGRYLWRSPKDPDLWKRVNFNSNPDYIYPDSDKKRREFCLGAGGHTHYWDETAPEIAQELERLID
ncbi:MAG: hypothetical protein QNJ18_15585 [Xenococcaceae cyanobacterium MO_167.B52]|nr:hypothetical protein [Xenococcaceae cyanobacterium MO_167.B52]